jgi:hypothetical protein
MQKAVLRLRSATESRTECFDFAQQPKAERRKKFPSNKLEGWQPRPLSAVEAQADGVVKNLKPLNLKSLNF